MRHVDFLVAVIPLSSPVCSGTFAFVAVFSRSPLDTHTIYRLYATWRDHLELLTVFCFAFLCHWVLDLASTIAFFVVAYQRDIHPSSEVCLDRGLEPRCGVPSHPIFVIVTVGLYLFKVIAVCECLRFLILPQMHLTVLLDAHHVMYNYRRTLLSRSPHSSSHNQNPVRSPCSLPRPSVAQPSRSSNSSPKPFPSPSDTTAPSHQQASQP